MTRRDLLDDVLENGPKEESVVKALKLSCQSTLDLMAVKFAFSILLCSLPTSLLHTIDS